MECYRLHYCFDAINDNVGLAQLHSSHGVAAQIAARTDACVAQIPADGCHRPETDRAKISRNLDSSDLSCELTVIYLCRSVIYLCHLVIYSL